MSWNNVLKFALALMYLQFLFIFFSVLAMLLSLSLQQILIPSRCNDSISLAPSGPLQSPIFLGTSSHVI